MSESVVVIDQIDRKPPGGFASIQLCGLTAIPRAVAKRYIRPTGRPVAQFPIKVSLSTRPI
jgi:hypothetical protein